MIKKLRRQFIMIAMVSIAAVMAFYAFSVIAVQHFTTVREINELLSFIIDNDGTLSTINVDMKNYDIDFSPEFRFRTRFFSAVIRGDRIALLETDNISALTDTQMETLARGLAKSGRRSGNQDNYYFRVKDREDGKLMVVLDATDQISAVDSLRTSSIFFVIITVILVLIPVWLLSAKAIKPEIENARKQKQFITNASHELKTPLAVIRANTELMELTEGENEWTQSTLQQVDRMNGLIADLVSLARYEEHREDIVFSEYNISDAANKAVKTFEPVAEQKGLTIVSSVEDGVVAKCDPEGIKQLINILLDNAVKYCDADGEIRLELSRHSKTIVLISSNNYADGKNDDYNRYFERFYRADESHKISNPKGGYGIGLSIAQEIVNTHKGSIKASWKDGRIYFTVELNR